MGPRNIEKYSGLHWRTVADKIAEETVADIKMAGILDTIKKIFVSTDPKALAAKAALSLLILGAPTGLSAQEAADFAKKEPEKVVETITEATEKTEETKEVEEEKEEKSKPEWYGKKEEGKRFFFFNSEDTKIPAGKTLADVATQETVRILNASYKELLTSYGAKESVKMKSDIAFEVLDIMLEAKSKAETIDDIKYLRVSMDTKLIHDALDRLMTKYVKK